MSGVVPAKIAASFTMGELAVLTVIARQCQRAGVCILPQTMSRGGPTPEPTSSIRKRPAPAAEHHWLA
jgi:hypothetical protein